jgi:hypothetical protein
MDAQKRILTGGLPEGHLQAYRNLKSLIHKLDFAHQAA